MSFGINLDFNQNNPLKVSLPFKEILWKLKRKKLKILL